MTTPTRRALSEPVTIYELPYGETLDIPAEDDAITGDREENGFKFVALKDYNKLRDRIAELETRPAVASAAVSEREKQMLDELDTAWGIIANAGGGNWTLESKDWQDAAARFREVWHARLDKQRAILEAAGVTSAAVRTEFAWVCEKGSAPTLEYLTVREFSLQWSTNHMDAIRFARRADAEQIALIVEETERIVEHGWDILEAADGAR